MRQQEQKEKEGLGSVLCYFSHMKQITYKSSSTGPTSLSSLITGKDHNSDSSKNCVNSDLKAKYRVQEAY